MTRREADFWAITTYFNLTNGRNRLRNYHCFKRHLPLPLLTVEWHPHSRFQLKSDEAGILLQLGGGDLMWQKERLLSAAVAALPDHVKYVAWIDCDILFEDSNWVDQARGLLERNSVVQLFNTIAYAGEKDTSYLINSGTPELRNVDWDLMRKRESFLSLYGRVKADIVRFDIDCRFKNSATDTAPNMRPVPGFAWAAQTAFLRNVGFYDRCIMGAGDMLFCYSVTGLSQALIDQQKAAGWGFYGDCQSYHRWAAAAAAACRDRLECRSGRILHLFHGDLENRQYKSRIDGLIPFALDLDRDIYAEHGQPWSWQRDRDQLNAYFLNYMRARKEDDEIIASRFEFGRG